MTAIEDKIQAHPINETATEFLTEAGERPTPTELLPMTQLALWFLSKTTTNNRENQEAREFLELVQSNPLAAAMEFATDRVELVRAMQAAREAGQDWWPLLAESLDSIHQSLKEADDPGSAGAVLVGNLIDSLTIDWM